MSKRSEHDSTGQPAPQHAGHPGADHPPGEPAQPGGRGGDLRHDRLDTIEWADDRTRALDPHHGGLDEAPIDDLVEGADSDAQYRDHARQATPTLDPQGGREDRR